jgi:hypothetical protein
MSYEPEEADELHLGGPSRGLEKVKLPAIFLIITAVLNLLLGGYLIFNSVVIFYAPADVMKEAMKQQPEVNRKQIEELEKQGFSLDKILKGYAGAFLAIGALSIISSILTIAGGAMMLSGKAYGLAVTGAVLTTIPCITSPCCIFGLPFGIWSLVVLFNPEVKAAFRR